MRTVLHTMAAYASELESLILRHGCTDHQSRQLVAERDLAAANIHAGCILFK